MKTTIAIKVLLTGRFEKPQEWNLELPAMPPPHAADLVFALSNKPEEWQGQDALEILARFPRTGLRSVSVGDVIIIGDAQRPDVRHIGTVEGCGFKFH